MIEFPIYSSDELKRRLKRYRAPKPKWHPLPGSPKSTKLCINDLVRLAGIDDSDIYKWFTGKQGFGKIRLRRLSKFIYLADNGYIQKLQWKKYIIHDKPFQPPVNVMRVVIGPEGVQLGRVPKDLAPVSMPDFSKIFGEKK